jgi:hypothetical protein
MRALAAFAIAAGCSSPPSAAVDAPPPIDTPLVDGPPLPPFPQMIAVGAASGSLAIPFRVDASGSAGSPLGTIAMTGDVGTMTSEPAFTYMSEPFGSFTIFQGFAVTASRWDVFWLYCMTGNTLTDVYDEGVDGPTLFFRAATGSCTSSPITTTATISLPALTMPAPSPIATDHVVTGNDVYIGSDGRGMVAIGGVQMPLVVFGVVDCTSACGSPGWYELHSIVWDGARATATFVIAYLLESDHSSVSFEYARALPGLDDPIGPLVLPATWTVTPGAPARERVGQFGVPPPPRR